MAVLAFDAADRCAYEHPNAKAGEALRHMRGNLRRDGTGKQPFLRLDNGHAAPAVSGLDIAGDCCDHAPHP